MKYAGLLLIILLLLCYTVPWTEAGSSGLYMNAYDWAEWLSLHPTERSAEVPLLLALVLRIQLLGLCVLLACLIPSTWHWFYVSLLLLLVVAQLPPLEFLANNQDNNYRQQAFLAASATVLSLLVRAFMNQRWRELMVWFVAFVSCASILISLPRALSLTHAYYSHIGLTTAPFVFVALYIGYLALIWNHKRSSLQLLL